MVMYIFFCLALRFLGSCSIFFGLLALTFPNYLIQFAQSSSSSFPTWTNHCNSIILIISWIHSVPSLLLSFPTVGQSLKSRTTYTHLVIFKSLTSEVLNNHEALYFSDLKCCLTCTCKCTSLHCLEK